MYTYIPEMVDDYGKDRMRLELGDTAIGGEGETAALSDEEYAAIIDGSTSWIRAKYRCLEAICMKLSFEADYTVDHLSYKFGERAQRWQKMLQEAKNDLSKSSGGIFGIKPARSIPNSFYIGIHGNQRGGL